LIVSVGAIAYSVVRLTAPHLTSQDYKDLASGKLQVAPLVMGYPHREGTEPDLKAYFDSARRAVPSDLLEEERRRGAVGIAIWGTMLLLSAFTCRGAWTQVRRLRSNNRWRGP
jgi:hypothetical protein